MILEKMARKLNNKYKAMSVNKIILIGNTTQDPSIKTFEDGNKVATFGLAMNERGYTLKNGTQVPERTEFVNLVVWRGLAEVVEKYVTKGDKLYIEGKIRTRSYEDKQGVKRYITEVYADNLEMLGSPKENTQSNFEKESAKVQERADAFSTEPDDLPF